MAARGAVHPEKGGSRHRLQECCLVGVWVGHLAMGLGVLLSQKPEELEGRGLTLARSKEGTGRGLWGHWQRLRQSQQPPHSSEVSTE